ncbi:unnamed protein product [Linum trigynum]|uniref:peptidylprolyl isomerase n=1 Tax=Linum trigynum TaxID=586398 RepID=A0AAV2E1Z8_9ROSI
MAFWGVEVKPGRPFTHTSDGGNRRLHVSQASLGNGTATNKSILQCNVGNKSPICLCTLFPNNSEVCQIHVEYQETDDVVFSVIGPRSVHLSGYYKDYGGNHKAGDDSVSYGEDIGDSDTDRSVHDSEEDGQENSFINDGDPGTMSASLVSGDGVKEVNAKPVNQKCRYKRLRKTYKLTDSDDDNSSDHQAKGFGYNVDAGVDSEEDDGLFLISSLHKKKPSARVHNETDLPSNNLTLVEQPSAIVDGNQQRHRDELKSQMKDKGKLKNLHEADGPDDFFSVSILKWPNRKDNEKKNDKVGDHVSLLKEVDKDAAYFGSPPKQTDLQKSEKRKRKRKVLVDGYASQEKCDNSFSIKEDGENHGSTPTVLYNDFSSPAEYDKDNSSSLISICLADQVVAETDQEGKKRKKRKIDKLGKALNAGASVPSKAEENEHANIEDDAVEIKSSQELGSQSVDDTEEGKEKRINRQKLRKRLNAETPAAPKGEDNQPAKIDEGFAKTKLSQVQTFAGGLLVEELEPGKTEGRLAALGRKISVSYTGKWKNTGEVLNSNIDGRPLKFVLGGEEVTEAWNVGLNGMRVGELRRLTFPAPSCTRSSSTRHGNGSEGVDGGEVITTTVPPLPLDCDVDDKSEGAEKWLVYDVKLLKVRKNLE